MKRRVYFDINCSIGKLSYKHNMTPYKIEDLIEESQYFGICSMALFNNVCKDYSYIKGNREIIEQLSGYERIYPVFCVVPGIEYELDEGYGYCDYLIKNGAKAFQFFPKSLNHEFSPFFMNKIVQYMILHKLPLIIDINETKYTNLEAMLREFKDLKVILLNSSWRDNRVLFLLLEKYKNLYFDLSSNQANDIIEITKKHFGIDRILFGTNYPFKSMGAAKAMIEYAQISDEEKDMIAYKNSCKVLNINPDYIKPYAYNENKLDEIATKVDNGQPLDGITVIDAHAHVIDKKDKCVSYAMMFNSDEDSIVNKMRITGVDKTVLLAPWEGITTDSISANETLTKIKEKYPDKFEIFTSYNPNYPEELKDIIGKYNKEKGFIGLKPYWTFQNTDLLGEYYKTWFEYGNANNLIMLIHSGPKFIADNTAILAERYPNITYILAHSGTSFETADYNIAIAKNYNNVYLEITFTSVVGNMIEYIVHNLSADKVLFGTDTPMRDPTPQLGWVAYAKISVEDKKKILGKNMEKILNKIVK